MISPQDFERLSAYVDNQLPPAEKAVVERQLAQDPELRQALIDMRRAILALRTLPVLKPPRNFTLSRAQVAPAPQWQWFSAMRLATALAGLLFVVIVVSDLMSQSTGGAVAPEAAMSQADLANVTEVAPANDSAIKTANGGDATPIPEVAPPEISLFTDAPTATLDSAARIAVVSTETPATMAAYPAGSSPTELSANAQAYPVEVALDRDRWQWRVAEVGLALLTIFLALAAWRGRKRTHTGQDELH